MCIKKLLPWIVTSLVILSFVMLFSAGIKSCTIDPRIKFGAQVEITGGRHLKFYDSCTGIVTNYAGEGSYKVDATCVTYNTRDGEEVVLTKQVKLHSHKSNLEVID